MTVELTPHQLAACDRVLDAASDTGFAMLGGAAGTGKTTCIWHLVHRLLEDHFHVDICTPTHKAAQVLRTKGLPDATTYHSVFFTCESHTVTDANGRVSEALRFVPRDMHEDGTLKGDWVRNGAVVIDEASMVSTAHIEHIRRMCKVVVLVGDPHQLPPVENDGGGLGVFNSADLTAELTEVIRQAEGSPILELATEIRLRHEPDTATFAPSPAAKLADAIRNDVQVICYTNETRKFVNYAARRALNRQSPAPEAGDKVVFGSTFNDGKGTLYPAGTPALVLGFDAINDKDPWAGGFLALRLQDGTEVEVQMDMQAFYYDLAEAARPDPAPKFRTSKDARAAINYGYAITAHKAQGSEYPKVLVVDERARIFNPDPEVAAETKARWLYTCVTRAQSKLFVVKRSWLGGLK